MAPDAAVFSSESLSLAGDVLLKMGLGVLLGGAIGWEREASGRPAGVRTHMLMVLGVILFGEVSKHFAAPADPTRIAAQILTGVGFLGAGTILRIGPQVKGLTTAASIWAAAAIGLAVSAGGAFLVVAVGATVLALLTLAFVDTIERRFMKRVQFRSVQMTLASREVLAGVLARIAQMRQVSVYRVHVVSQEPELVVELDLKGRGDTTLTEIAGLEGVVSVSVPE